MRVAFAVTEKDLALTQGRLLYLVESFTLGGFHVSLLTNARYVADRARELLGRNDKVSIVMHEREILSLPLSARDDLVRSFIKLVHDRPVPGTDFPFWKATAFDDFRGFISSSVYRHADFSDARCLLLPLPTLNDPLPEIDDVFLSSLIMQAKNEGVRVILFQMHPVPGTPMLYHRLADGVIVKSDEEKTFYVSKGVDAAKLHVLDQAAQRYCIDTVENAYLNHVLSDSVRQVTMTSADPAIMIINDPRYRSEIAAVLESVVPMNNIRVFFQKRVYKVRTLTEERIMSGLYGELFSRLGDRLRIVEGSDMLSMLMIAHVVVAPVYLVPLRFAATFGKKAIVYNQSIGAPWQYEGVSFISERGILEACVHDAVNAHRAQESFADIVSGIIG